MGTERLLAAVRPAEHVVALDERGTQLSTRELAAWLKTDAGKDLFRKVIAPWVPADVLSRPKHTSIRLAWDRSTTG